MTTEPAVAPPDDRSFMQRYRRPIKVAAIGVGCLFGVFVLTFGYLVFQLRHIHRISVGGIHPAGPGQAQNILVAGSDSRAGITGAAAQHFGSTAQVQGQRSDVIVIVHLDPRTGSASLLSIPRDLFVPISGIGSSNRINVAFNQGPSQLVKTITDDFGITINHYVQEDFSGLQAITDAVGGVCMNFPMPVRDGSPTGQGNESGLNIPVAGKQTIHGAMALSLVRSRYYQYFSNGSWHAEGTGDIGRIERQHQFMRVLATKTIHAALGNPFTARAVLGKAVGGVTIDDSFTSIGLMRLGLKLRSVHPAAIPSWTLPYHSVNNYRSFGDVLMPSTAEDAAVISAWQSYGAPGTAAAAAPVTVAPSAVTVTVRNGSGVAGQAQRTATELRAAGFNVAGFSTASAAAQASTTVAYASGQQAAAQTVAKDLVGPLTLQVDKSLSGANVVVTTGTGFGGVRTSAPAAPAAAAAPPASAAPPWDPGTC